ncbi:MAG: 2-C-methyl-D-erythritol 2,4-cyclodiphosphate synthase [Pseudomonadota bacterium]
MFRIGHGYDAHRFGGEGPLKLGGVDVPHNAGLLAHSDGDVVLHALSDALLGAAALGDIGRHFPDSDAQYANADSGELLRETVQLVRQAGFGPVNADLTVVAQTPRLAPFIPSMQARIAALLAIDAGAVNVKATTTERMGFVGREEGIVAHAVALITALARD